MKCELQRGVDLERTQQLFVWNSNEVFSRKISFGCSDQTRHGRAAQALKGDLNAREELLTLRTLTGEYFFHIVMGNLFGFGLKVCHSFVRVY